MKNSLIPYNEVEQFGHAMVSSGFFSDVEKVSQAIVKIQAGAEIGLPPFASMTGVHIIKGKPVLGANLIATLIKNDPRYDYRVAVHTDEECVITFIENGEQVGVSSFTTADAKKAGINNQNWNKYPRNMLFARAISNGAKWYTPGIFGGMPVYTPDEFDLQVDEDGDVLTGEVVQTEPQPAPQATEPRKPSDKMFKKLWAVGNEVYAAEWETKRRELVKSVTKGRTDSSKDITFDECKKLIDGIEAKRVAEPAPLFPDDGPVHPVAGNNYNE